MEELKYMQDHSCKYKIREYEICANVIPALVNVKPKSYEEWNAQTQYWIDLIKHDCGNIDYLKKLSDNGNSIVTSALGKT